MAKRKESISKQAVEQNKVAVTNYSNLKKETTQEKAIAPLLFHPILFYLKKEQAFERKLRYYTPTIFRKFSIENNAPYFRIMMKRYFYYYKPNGRWKRTMKTATLRKARRKLSRIPRILSPAASIVKENNNPLNFLVFRKNQTEESSTNNL